MRNLVLVSIIITFNSCLSKIGASYPLYLQNNVDHPITIYFNDDHNHKSIYPDTSISNFEKGYMMIESGNREWITSTGGASWENIFEVSVPNDTLSLLVFHSDTLSKYSWSEIRKSYNLLVRYDLCLEDLKRLDFNLTYPPNEEMKEIKMWFPSDN